jgi:flagellar biosynthetic protein FlhB
MPADEKTETATPRKREEVRQKGQVARSAEITAAVGLLVGLATIRFFGGSMLRGIERLTVSAFAYLPQAELTPQTVYSQGLATLAATAGIVGPVLVAAMVAGLAANFAQVGFLFASQPIIPDFNRLNPIQGLARIFSVRAAAELGKSLAKVLVVGCACYSFLRGNYALVLGMSAMSRAQMGAVVARLMWHLLLRAGVVLLVIAVLDYMFQRMQFEKSIRMTRQEVKDEFKRMEGDPTTKSRIRQRQRAAAHARMMQAVARATAVVTNPTHVAVALRYEPLETPAPVVVAKGQRKIAERIREVAREHDVPIVENRELAWALFRQVELNRAIPADLYQAVAEIVAFVYRLSGREVE